jgi:hypothetical protein
LATLLTGMVGCSQSAIPPNRDSHDHAKGGRTLASHHYGGVAFAPPKGWTMEEVQGGLLIISPTIEANWQANLFLQVRQDNENRSLDEAMAEYIRNLKSQKHQFRDVNRAVENHLNGFRFGRIDYTCVQQETELRQCEWLIELEGTKRLFVFASSASSLWPKYQPIFREFIDSLHANRK